MWTRRPLPKERRLALKRLSNKRRHFEIERFLHPKNLKSEIRNCKLDYANCDGPI